MSIGHCMKTILLAAGVTSLQAEVPTHPFNVETGMVMAH